jgi:hypothetical protein
VFEKLFPKYEVIYCRDAICAHKSKLDHQINLPQALQNEVDRRGLTKLTIVTPGGCQGNCGLSPTIFSVNEAGVTHLEVRKHLGLADNQNDLVAQVKELFDASLLRIDTDPTHYEDAPPSDPTLEGRFPLCRGQERRRLLTVL